MKQKNVRQRNLLLAILIFVFMILSVMGSYVTFDYADYLKGGLWLMVTLLLGVALLMVLDFIKVKNRNTSVLVLMIAFLVFVLSVLLPDYLLDDYLPKHNVETIRWSEIKLHEKLPEPVSTQVHIYSNTSDLLDMYIYDMYAFRYDDYVYECESLGYTLDVDKDNYSFTGYNEEGYELSLWFDEDDERMQITLYPPIELGEIFWPTTGLGSSLPVPSSLMGKIESDSSYGFSVYIGDTSLKGFEAYINACIKAGYNVDYNRYDRSFYAYNEDKDSLHIRYKGHNIMYISLYKQ